MQRTTYNSVYQAEKEQEDSCVLRPDASGTWNAFKAWYLFLLHFIACGGFYSCMVYWIHGRYFKTGKPESLLWIDGALYQTEVNGLISLALVLVRIVTGCCATLIVWRTIFILLEKRGTTLVEICHMNSRLPVLPRLESTAHLFWSCFGMAVIILLWPSSLASPLVSSSLAWIPSRIPVQSPAQEFRIKTFDNFSAAMDQYRYEEAKMSIILNAASMAEKDPAYAFNDKSLHLRRYFSLTPRVNESSLANTTLPYFEVTNLTWINRENYSGYEHVGDPAYSAVTRAPFESRINGLVAIMMDTVWSAVQEFYTPIPSEKVDYRKTIAVKLRTLEKHDRMEDGSYANWKTPCPPRSETFGELPSVKQHNRTTLAGEDWAATDCHLLAEVSFRVGKTTGIDCNTSSTATPQAFTTCEVGSGREIITNDWIAGLTLETMSEVMKSIAVLNFTGPWQNDLDTYTSGMLTLAYHATWSAITEKLSYSTEPILIIPTEEVVRASVEGFKMYGWLMMQATLTASAILVAIAQSRSRTKTIRNPTVAALTLNLHEVCHDSRALGLCNAVELSREDKKLGRMRWEGPNVGKDPDGKSSMMGETLCHYRRITFEQRED